MKVSISAGEIEELVKKYIEEEFGIKVKPGDIRWNHDGTHPVYPVAVEVKT